MRRIAWLLLLVYAFTIPWEYSLDLGAPLGNVARITGLLLLAAAIPAVLQAGRARMPGLLLWLVLVLYLWICCSCLWSVDRVVTLEKLRAFFQEMMVVWLVWEFAESPRDLRMLLRATVLGCWVLAALTLVEFRPAALQGVGQARFAAFGQDPNDVARFLDLGLPIAALLGTSERRWLGKLFAYGYLPLALLTVMLTASRGGFLAAVVAVAGSLLLLLMGRPKMRWAALFALPAIAAVVWCVVPAETLERLATIPEQLSGGSLNQRFEIWSFGWRAFVKNPVLGNGMGNFSLAAGLSPEDTAHNTVLAILVGGGLCALSVCTAIVGVAIQAIVRLRARVRIAMATAMAVWIVTAMVATVEESRFTWLFFGMAALAGRLVVECPVEMDACFPETDAIPEGRGYSQAVPGRL